MNNPIIYTALILLFSCGKDKQKPANLPQPPVVDKTCRLTNYIATPDQGGNGNSYGFSYDENFNLVQATGFTVQGNKDVTIKIGPNGVNRDNGASIIAYTYPVNIYTENPATASTTIVTNTTLKRSETYKYDDKKRLIQVNITDDKTGVVMNEIHYRYDDNNNNTETDYIGGNSRLIQTVRAKYDDHPSAYINITGRKFMHWIESFEVWNPDFKFSFDMMSDHNITEWEQITYNEAGIATGSYKATFVYKYIPQTGRPETRTESYYVDGLLKATYNEIFSYTGCD